MAGKSTTTSVEKHFELEACEIQLFWNASVMNGQPLLSPVLSRSETAEHSSVLEVFGLTKVYRSRSRTITAFENIAFSLRQGEIAVVLGPSGCGKSSFLKTVSGLEIPTRGSVRALNQIVLGPIPSLALSSSNRFFSPG